LASRGRFEIGAPDHQRNALLKVVDGCGKLIRPIAVPVSDQDVPALFSRDLRQRAGEQVVCLYRACVDSDAQPAPGLLGQGSFPAAVAVPFSADVGSRAVAGIDAPEFSKLLQRTLIHLVTLALAQKRAAAFVGLESQPVEILEQRGDELGAGSDSIVILHAQHNTPAEGASHAPCVKRVDDVSEVEVAGWRWCKPCDGRPGEQGVRCGQIGSNERHGCAASPLTLHLEGSDLDSCIRENDGRKNQDLTPRPS